MRICELEYRWNFRKRNTIAAEQVSSASFFLEKKFDFYAISSMRVRRYFFALNRQTGEIVSTMERNSNGTTFHDGLKGLRQSEPNSLSDVRSLASPTPSSRYGSKQALGQDANASPVGRERSMGNSMLFSEHSGSPSFLNGPSHSGLFYYSVRTKF